MRTLKGSGVAVLVAQGFDTINATVTLDKGSPETFLLDYPVDVTYNVAFFDIQQLPLADHTLKIRLETWSPRDNRVQTSMLFDYVIVNTTAPSPGATPITSSAPASPSRYSDAQ